MFQDHAKHTHLEGSLVNPGRHDDVDVLVLHEVSNDFPDARRDHVGREPQEDFRFHVPARLRRFEVVVVVFLHGLVRQAPGAHALNLLDRQADVRRLEARRQELAEEACARRREANTTL